jgi:hypothetical protein
LFDAFDHFFGFFLALGSFLITFGFHEPIQELFSEVKLCQVDEALCDEVLFLI